jgi:hypothetical protein
VAILFADDFTSDTTRARRESAGKIVTLARGIWSDELGEPPSEIIPRYWQQIVARFMPGAVVTGRSAFTHEPVDGELFLSHLRWRPMILPGLAIYPDGRAERRHDDIEIAPSVYGASLARALLDNAETRGRPSTPSRRLSHVQLRETIRKISERLDQQKWDEMIAEVKNDPNTVAAEIVLQLVGSLHDVPLFEMP